MLLHWHDLYRRKHSGRRIEEWVYTRLRQNGKYCGREIIFNTPNGTRNPVLQKLEWADDDKLSVLFDTGSQTVVLRPVKEGKPLQKGAPHPRFAVSFPAAERAAIEAKLWPGVFAPREWDEVVVENRNLLLPFAQENLPSRSKGA